MKSLEKNDSRLRKKRRDTITSSIGCGFQRGDGSKPLIGEVLNLVVEPSADLTKFGVSRAIEQGQNY